MTEIATLRTDRLTLRAPEIGDLPAFISFYASTQSHTVGGPRMELEAAMSLDAMLGHWITKGFGSWVITAQDDDGFLGRTGFLIGPGWEAPELGWAVTAQAEGKGIAYEATLAARQYGATHLGLDAPISYIRPDNTRSAALAGRLGARVEKTHADWRGKPCDVWRHPAIGSPS
jgi:RimJ/RimL family protein N-acetyltransferase